jgi:hypothetical protein
MKYLKKSQPIQCLQDDGFFEGKSYRHFRDKQPLGFILEKGKKIEFRQSNPFYKGTLTLELYSNTSDSSISLDFSNSKVSLTADENSAVFVETPYVSVCDINVLPVIEYEYPENSKPLLMFRNGDNAHDFFLQWNKVKNEFALIESKFIMILLPYDNKLNLKKISVDGNEFSYMLEFYDYLLEFYNNLTSLTLNSRYVMSTRHIGRYFFKTHKYDLSKVSLSFYSHSGFWISFYSSGFRKKLLKKSERSHEGKLYSRISFLDLWRNSFSARYINGHFEKIKYKKVWLFKGEQEDVESTITKNIDAMIPLNNWSNLREKIYFLMLMIHCIGIDTFTLFYKKNFHQYPFESYYPHEDSEVMDIISFFFTQLDSKIDVTPFILLAGGRLSNYQKEINRFTKAKVVYPANQFVSGDALHSLLKKFNLNGKLSLVDVQQLKSTGLRGNVYLELNSAGDFDNNIKNGYLSIFDGGVCVRKIRITKSKLIIRGLPIGVYNLMLPTGRNEKKEARLNYLIVRPGVNKVSLQYWNVWHPQIASQKITLQGLRSEPFLTVTIDQGSRMVSVSVINTNPNVLFSSREYARVTLRDNNGNIVFKKSISGIGVKFSHDKTTFNYQDHLEIYHAECGHRINLTPAFDGIIDSKAKINTFTLTQAGLLNNKLKNNPLAFLESSIENVAKLLREHTYEYESEYSHAKVQIWLAIKIFPYPKRSFLLKKYSDCIPLDNGIECL